MLSRPVITNDCADSRSTIAHAMKVLKRPQVATHVKLPVECNNHPVLEGEHSRLRSAIAVLLYLQADLPDAMFTIRLLSGFMVSPTHGSWKILHHLVSYLTATAG